MLRGWVKAARPWWVAAFWWCVNGVVRRCPTLPHAPACSTIGAVRLSFRVRNVSGRFPHAMTAGTIVDHVGFGAVSGTGPGRCPGDPHEHGWFVGREPYSVTRARS